MSRRWLLYAIEGEYSDALFHPLAVYATRAEAEEVKAKVEAAAGVSDNGCDTSRALVGGTLELLGRRRGDEYSTVLQFVVEEVADGVRLP